MGKLVDVCILTVLWFVCSALWLPLAAVWIIGEATPNLLILIAMIPSLVLIGPCSTGVYYVTLKLVRDEESYTVRSFFKSFRDNFKQAAVIGALMTAIGLFFIWDIYLYFNMGSQAMTIIGIVFIGIFLMYLFTVMYVYALEAKFYNTVLKTMRNALFMSVKHIFRSLAMLIIAAVVIVGCLFFPPLILLSVGLIAFLHSFFLVKIFDLYIPKEDQEQHHDELEAGTTGIEEEQVHIVVTREDVQYGNSQLFDRGMLNRQEPPSAEPDQAAGQVEAAAGEAAGQVETAVGEAAGQVEAAAGEAAGQVEAAAGETAEKIAEETADLVKEASRVAEAASEAENPAANS